jgi:hypothetical protein
MRTKLTGMLRGALEKFSRRELNPCSDLPTVGN